MSKNTVYRVSYNPIMGKTIEKRETTEVYYVTKPEAQKYANQLNDGKRFKNARVKKSKIK